MSDERQDPTERSASVASATHGPGAAGAPGTHILLFEDDDTLAGLLARVLRADGYHVDILDDADAIPSAARLARYDVVLSDIHLANDTSGHDVLKRVRAASPATPVILMTAYADIEGAMTAVGEGAYDYLAKPIEPNELKRMVGEAIARRKLAQGAEERRRRRGATSSPTRRSSARTPAMLAVYKTVAQVAPTTATVLIVGESGTGKELVARAIHAKSPRANKPFVAVNCAALPESLLESELFGHERGAFTGASAHEARSLRGGRGGTLFLDEIGEIAPKMQVKLLRVLQEGEIRRVGAAETIKVDVRVVAATNRDLKTEVAERALPRGSLLPAAGRDRPRAAAARAAAATSRCSCVTSSRGTPSGSGDRRRASRPRCIECSRPTRSRATCASCRTSSSARCSSRAKGVDHAAATCRPT